jgi:hypothetical protein
MQMLNSELIGDVAYAYVANEEELAEFASQSEKLANDVNFTDIEYVAKYEYNGEGVYVAELKTDYSSVMIYELNADDTIKLRRQLRQLVGQAKDLLNAF